MSIEYSGGTTDVRTVVVGANCTQDLSASIAASTAAAGWTVTTLGQYNYLFGTSNPTNTQTATINSRVYTFKTVLASADDIKIGATALETLQNFKAAINGEAGAGTKYGTGTTTNVSVQAAAAVSGNINGSTRAFLVIYSLGASGITVAATTTLAWVNASNLSSTLYKMVSVQTPQFQKITCYIGGTPNNIATSQDLLIMNRDLSNGAFSLQDRTISNGQTYRTIAHRYGFHNHLVGTYNTRGTGMYVQTLFLPSNIAPKSITGATNATPIVITTSAAHGYSTGDSVINRYVEGNLAANGTFTITVLSPTTYSLDTSVGTGAFSGTLGLSQCLTPPRRTQAEVVIANFGTPSGDEWIVGSTFYFGVGTGVGAAMGILDGTPWFVDAAYNGFFPGAVYYTGSLIPYTWLSGDYAALEPAEVYSSQYGGSCRGGQLYNAFIVQNSSIAGGATITADGHNWYGVYNNSTAFQLFLAVS